MIQNLLTTMQLVESKVKMDDLSDGVIETKTFQPFFNQLNIRISEEEIQSMIKELDPNEEGVVKIVDFTFLLEQHLQKYVNKEELLESFRVFDSTRTGQISVSKMRLILFQNGGMQSEETDELIFEMLEMKKPAPIDPTTSIDYVKFADKLFENS